MIRSFLYRVTTRIAPYLTSLAVAFSFRPAYAQKSILVDSARSCPACRITFTKVASLGKPSDPGSLSAFASLTVDSKGRFLVGPTANPGEIFIYDSRGRFLRSIGRHGSGPGEFGRVFSLAIGPGDSVHLADATQRRYTLLAPNYAVVRTTPLPGRPNDLLPIRGGVLFQTTSFDQRMIGIPIHLLTSDGRIERSFGVDGSVHRIDEPDNDVRSLAPDGDSLVWVARRNKYEVQLWNVRTGRWVLSVVRDPPWFKPWRRGTRGQPTSAPPPPQLLSVWLDDQHRMWTATLVADQHWQPAKGKGDLPLSPEVWEVFYDTIVEVIDLNAMKLVTSTRYPRALWLSANRNNVFDYFEHSNGDVGINLWRTTIIPKGVR